VLATVGAVDRVLHGPGAGAGAPAVGVAVMGKGRRLAAWSPQRSGVGLAATNASRVS
jgi:hypothetical protein